MTIELTEAEKIKLLNSEDIYSIMQKVLLREEKIDQNKEHFWILGLANNNRLLFIELISLGTVNKTLVEPMEVFSLALQKQAVKIILCHNHPSGELKPSEEDQDVTNRMIQVGLIINMPVIDHLIISDISYLSFEDIGLLAVLKLSTKYVPGYMLIQRIQEQAAELTAKKVAEAKERAMEARIRRDREIVNQLRAEGLDIAVIMRITGLSKGEIEGL
ncbi:MAG: JAB domain-containing protein [Aureispira sp.]